MACERSLQLPSGFAKDTRSIQTTLRCFQYFPLQVDDSTDHFLAGPQILMTKLLTIWAYSASQSNLQCACAVQPMLACCRVTHLLRLVAAIDMVCPSFRCKPPFTGSQVGWNSVEVTWDALCFDNFTHQCDGIQLTLRNLCCSFDSHLLLEFAVVMVVPCRQFSSVPA